MTPCVMGGTTGPATVAGLLVVQHAETLAGLVLSQLAAPGAPFIYGGLSSISSMQTGELMMGAPQFLTVVAATIGLADHLGLPCRAGGAITDAHALDFQAGAESALALGYAIELGADFILHGAGGMSSINAVSFEKMVVDDELVGILRSRPRSSGGRRGDAGVGHDRRRSAPAAATSRRSTRGATAATTCAHRSSTAGHTTRGWRRGPATRPRRPARGSPSCSASYEPPEIDAVVRRQLERYCLE